VEGISELEKAEILNLMKSNSKLRIFYTYSKIRLTENVFLIQTLTLTLILKHNYVFRTDEMTFSSKCTDIPNYNRSEIVYLFLVCVKAKALKTYRFLINDLNKALMD